MLISCSCPVVEIQSDCFVPVAWAGENLKKTCLAGSIMLYNLKVFPSEQLDLFRDDGVGKTTKSEVISIEAQNGSLATSK